LILGRHSLRRYLTLIIFMSVVVSCKSRSAHQSSLKQENAKKIRYSNIELPFKQTVGFALDPLSRLAFLTSKSGESALIDLDRGQTIWKKPETKDRTGIYGEFSPSGTLLAINQGPGKIMIIATKTGEEISNLKPPCIDSPGPSFHVSKIVWSSDQRLLAAAVAKSGPVLPERQRFINIWDTQTGDCVLAVPAIGNILTLKFSSDARRLFSFSQDAHFSIYDLSRKSVMTITVDELKYPLDTYGAFFGGKVSFRDDARLAMIGWNRTIGEAGNPENPIRSMPMVVAIDLETGKKIWQREWTPTREERFFQLKTVEFDPSGTRIGVYIEPNRWFIVNSITGDVLGQFESEETGPASKKTDRSEVEVPNLFFSRNLDKFFGPISDRNLPIWGIN